MEPSQNQQQIQHNQTSQSQNQNNIQQIIQDIQIDVNGITYITRTESSQGGNMLQVYMQQFQNFETPVTEQSRETHIQQMMSIFGQQQEFNISNISHTFDVIDALYELEVTEQHEDIDVEQEIGESSDESFDTEEELNNQNIIYIQKECYTCLDEKQEFIDTCGEISHQICQNCYIKLQKIKGCPMCRNDLQGIIGKQRILLFFEDTNQFIYIDLYNKYLQLYQYEQFRIQFFFGDINDLEQFLDKVIKRCIFVVKTICNSDEQQVKQELKLIRSIIQIPQTSNLSTQMLTNQLALLLLQ